MILEYKGEIQIEEGLTLMNPKMELISVFYNLKTNEFKLELHFWETRYRHSRSFPVLNDSPGSLNIEYIMNFVSEHAILSLFSEVVSE